MSNISTTFWELLNRVNIEVPIIQRDYAQGRIGKENLRKRFLDSIKLALDDKHQLKLDFVYGSVVNNKFLPLDGQQRLTTLWLVHWYIALRAGELNSNCEILKRFSYETRISSREFCENLCLCKNFDNIKSGDKVVPYITNSTWFYASWHQDPTIKAMLNMLGGTNIENSQNEDIIDGIEELFSGCSIEQFKQYWEGLTKKKPILFSYLHLKDFGLSDDLYIKMNARGKALTPFENFKADLIDYIRRQADENQDSEWPNFLCPNVGVPKKLDTDWMNIFWKNREGRMTVDEIYFIFMNRFFWNELFIAQDSHGNYILNISDGKESHNASYRLFNADNGNTYNDFRQYKFGENGSIPISFFKNITTVLDRYKKYVDSGYEIPECAWDNTFSFIPHYVDDKVPSITQVQRIIFFAISKYFKEGEGDSDSLKRWLRVIWNLVSSEDIRGNANIRSVQAIRAAISFIGTLNSHNVYESLCNLSIEDSKDNSDFSKRCQEEIIKANKIKEEESWEDKIKKTEESLFFKGGIRFLYRGEDGGVDWDNYDEKQDKIKQYFCENGINEKKKLDVIQGFVAQISEINKIRDCEIFNSKKTTWNWILNNSEYQTEIHKLLTNKLENFKCEWPLEYMVTSDKFDGRGRFHYAYDKYAFYKPYGSDALLLDQDGFKRNAKLSEWSKSKLIVTDQRINGTDYFSGWDVIFKYKENQFVWKRDNKIYLYFEQDNVGINSIGKQKETNSVNGNIDDILVNIENLVKEIQL